MDTNICACREYYEGDAFDNEGKFNVESIKYYTKLQYIYHVILTLVIMVVHVNIMLVLISVVVCLVLWEASVKRN